MSDNNNNCSTRHFTWLIKHCILTPLHHPLPKPTLTGGACTTLSSLPDDILLEILSRAPLSSLPSLSLVSRRFAHLLGSPLLLHLRRLHRLLKPTVLAFSSHVLRLDHDSSWSSTDIPFDLCALVLRARVVAIGRKVFILGQESTAEFDSWTRSVRLKPGMISPRRNFAAAAVNGKIYVAGGSARVDSVEEYDVEKGEWRVVSHAPRKRYGCVGVGVEGMFFVIGGLKIGAWGSGDLSRAGVVGAEATAYASSMDVYDVEGRCWLRSRWVPGGGCVVAACGANGCVYVLTSHAVELSFWRFRPRRRGEEEWCRMKGPPVEGTAGRGRLDGTVRFGCVGVEDKVVLIQVKECLVHVFDCNGNEWSRGAVLPEVVLRAACVCVEC